MNPSYNVTFPHLLSILEFIFSILPLLTGKPCWKVKDGDRGMKTV